MTNSDRFRGFAANSSAVRFVRDLNTTQKAILRCIADHARDDGTNCTAGQDTLALESSVETKTVKRVLAQLEEKGYIRRGRRSGHPGIEISIDLDVLFERSQSGKAGVGDRLHRERQRTKERVARFRARQQVTSAADVTPKAPLQAPDGKLTASIAKRRKAKAVTGASGVTVTGASGVTVTGPQALPKADVTPQAPVEPSLSTIPYEPSQMEPDRSAAETLSRSPAHDDGKKVGLPDFWLKKAWNWAQTTYSHVPLWERLPLDSKTQLKDWATAVVVEAGPDKGGQDVADAFQRTFRYTVDKPDKVVPYAIASLRQLVDDGFLGANRAVLREAMPP